jgi:hypothetical protein
VGVDDAFPKSIAYRLLKVGNVACRADARYTPGRQAGTFVRLLVDWRFRALSWCSLTGPCQKNGPVSLMSPLSLY